MADSDSTVNFLGGLSVDILRAALSYDPGTGDLRWIVPPPTNAKPGEIAGYIASNGYRTIRVWGRTVSAHQTAWAIYHGEPANSHLDHINRIRTDNRIANLRKVTRAQNMWNAPSQTGATGVRGVYWHPPRNKYCASITADRKRHFLGYFDTVEAAADAYRDASRRIHGEYGLASIQEIEGSAN